MYMDPDDSLSASIRRASARMEAAGIDEPTRVARVLLGLACGMEISIVIAREQQPIGKAASTKFEDYIARRLSGEPVSRILGRRGFWKDEFLIDENVLDPRPDTETLIEAVLRYFGEQKKAALKILDLGTGSGAILCSLLREFPSAHGLGLDISSLACHVAGLNLERLNLDNRGSILNADWSKLEESQWDIIASNPPYIESATMRDLEPEVRLWDPPLALDGGKDGLDAYRSLAPILLRHLAPAGIAFLEIGFNQGASVPRVMTDAGLNVLGVCADLGGRPRIVAVSKSDALL